jgi:hypothetical protein
MLIAELKALTSVLGEAQANNVLKMAQDRGLTGFALEQSITMLLDRLLSGAGVIPGNDKITMLLRYKTQPVGIREFVESKFYLGKAHEVYPAVMETLVDLNSGRYDEAVLTGGIGSGKTTIALYSQAYQLYLLSRLRNPHGLFGLDSSSEIKIIFQSLRESLARGVDYERFRDMVEKSPYFQRHFMYDKDINSKLKFPNRIEVEPVGGNETASIGQNVIGGVIDEINFMAVVANSKQSSGGGVYDQAVELYNTIARRRKSRFMQAGHMPGLLCLVSSKKTPGQFTDVKEEEARTNSRIFVYDKRVWDIKPQSFSGERFQVFIGDAVRKPRLLTPSEVVSLEDRALIDHIPVEFKQEFLDDITKALRDIAGKSTAAIHPFMPDTERVTQGFGKVKSVIEPHRFDFSQTMPSLLPSRLTDPQAKRFCHIDLALRGDCAGVCVGHVRRFVKIKRDETYETLPEIIIDLAVEVAAPRGGEIEFSNIRRLLYKLREHGMLIEWVTLDSFQSADTLQILRSEGFKTGYQSMDTTMIPYQLMKSALYDGRVLLPTQPTLMSELPRLERDFKRGKIDHPANGSKDVSDALAGVVYGLTLRKILWLEHGVEIVKSHSVYKAMQEIGEDNGSGPARSFRAVAQ